ncbi:MAG: hypothetical protein ACLFR8_08755 [Alkalispirochaeta sp.]
MEPDELRLPDRWFPVVRIFTGEDGITHFEDGLIPLVPAGEIGDLSEAIPGGTVRFRRTDADYDYDWHPTPARQFIFMMSGAIEIEVGDGEIRRINAGQTLFLEDLASPGHRTRNAGPTPRWSVFVQTNENVPYKAIPSRRVE